MNKKVPGLQQKKNFGKSFRFFTTYKCYYNYVYYTRKKSFIRNVKLIYKKIYPPYPLF